MSIKERYKHLKVVIYFIILLLIVTLLLSGLRYSFDGKSFTSLMEAPIFIAVVSLFIGYLYCEIRAIFKNRHIGAIVFGLITPALFLLFLPMKSLLFGGEIQVMPIEFFISIEVIMGVLMSLIYIKTSKFV